MTGTSELTPGDQASAVCKVAFRAPPFWETNPELWFGQLESQFHLSGISTDSTKFHSVVAALNADVLSCATDLVRTPPADKMYETLKKRILSQYVQSDSTRLKLLLQEICLGDKRPSQLLLEMRNLGAGKVSDEVLRSLWLQRLPVSIQQILSACSESTLDGLAKVADKVNEVSGCTIGVAGIGKFDVHELRNEIASLREEVKQLSLNSRQRYRNQDRDRSVSRKRENSRKRSESSGLCWYHRRFGVKARDCIKPCEFSGN